MANRFTRWAPTQYVPLPIDYYQSALAYKEQKTQESLDKIDAILAGYGSIEPISKDPQALYEQTNEKVRKGVMDLANQNLDTPAAQRAVNKIINTELTRACEVVTNSQDSIARLVEMLLQHDTVEADGIEECFAERITEPSLAFQPPPSSMQNPALA